VTIVEEPGAGVELVRPQRFCPAVRRNGEPCKSFILLEDGFCSAHSALASVTPAERGRKGGLASGQVRAALANTARERLRKLADEDEVFWERLKAAYKDGLDAVDSDGNPDFRARVMTAGAFLAEAYGKPPQAIVGDEEKPLTFVLESAFRRGAG
jgi:hypothetical protein